MCYEYTTRRIHFWKNYPNRIKIRKVINPVRWVYTALAPPRLESQSGAHLSYLSHIYPLIWNANPSGCSYKVRGPSLWVHAHSWLDICSYTAANSAQLLIPEGGSYTLIFFFNATASLNRWFLSCLKGLASFPELFRRDLSVQIFAFAFFLVILKWFRVLACLKLDLS